MGFPPSFEKIYSSENLVESIRVNTESAIDKRHLTIEEGQKLIDQILVAELLL